MTVTKPQNATLIDSISEGYAAINRRPWLLLLPMLLNVYLWFGAQLSFGPLFNRCAWLLKSIQPRPDRSDTSCRRCMTSCWRTAVWICASS